MRSPYEHARTRRLLERRPPVKGVSRFLNFLLILPLMVVGLTLLAGCGGSSSDAAPAGTYTINKPTTQDILLCNGSMACFPRAVGGQRLRWLSTSQARKPVRGTPA